MTLPELRALAIARSLFAPVTLLRAIERLGFVQADPIRAPARAQDLTLRHRVTGYRAGDLERTYAGLAVEEDFFVNYGFLPRAVAALLHPRGTRRAKSPKRVARILEVVREYGEIHPRILEQRLRLGTVTNYWGGSSNATTHLLDGMHYGGLLRVVRREGGIRIYGERTLSAAATARARADALVALAIDKYAPLPLASLQGLTTRLRNAIPALAKELSAALARAKETLPRARIDGADWIWRQERELPEPPEPEERVRFLAPFDPVVWDRRRFEIFWGWAYRFEAYTPAKKRRHGYYALPVLWRDRVIGWANVAANGSAQLGFVSGKAPRDRAFARELEAEVERMRAFLR